MSTPLPTIRDILDMRFETLPEAVRGWQHIRTQGFQWTSGQADFYRFANGGYYFVVPRIRSDEGIVAIVESLTKSKLVDYAEVARASQ